jgi:hypothetical protein
MTVTLDTLRADDVSPGGFVIVPESVSVAINAKLDVEIEKWPDAEKERDALYEQLIWFFSKYGHVPDFTLEPKDTP